MSHAITSESVDIMIGQSRPSFLTALLGFVGTTVAMTGMILVISSIA